MTDLNEMWAELERYQPYAEKRGFGEAWRKMCEERTADVASAAAGAAWEASYTANAAEWAWAAWVAANAAEAAEAAAAEVAEWKGRAIKNIRDAIAQEGPL